MGQPQFTRITYNPYRNVRTLNLDFTDNLAPYSEFLVNVYAQQGYVGKVISMQAVFPLAPTAIEGTRSIGITSAGIFITRGDSNYNKTLQFDNSMWNADFPAPSDGASQLLALGKLLFDFDTPISFIFGNGTSDTITGTKTLRLLVEEEKIG